MGNSSQEIYQILEDEIISLKRKPGTIISENQLCEQFCTSRTPIRNSLQRLAEKGLVEIMPKKGTVVTRLDSNCIEQMIFLRVTVEARVLEEFISTCSPMDRERVRYALTSMSECALPMTKKDTEPFDSALFMKLDFQMHKIWFDVTKKDYIWNKLIWEDSSYARFCALDIINQKNVENSLSDHWAIMDLIDTRNVSGVYQLLEHHLYGGLNRLGARMNGEFKDYFKPLAF